MSNINLDDDETFDVMFDAMMVLPRTREPYDGHNDSGATEMWNLRVGDTFTVHNVFDDDEERCEVTATSYGAVEFRHIASDTSYTEYDHKHVFNVVRNPKETQT